MTENKKTRSTSANVRSNYLFLGLYLIAKLDIKNRMKKDSPKEYLRSFERMENFFNKKLDTLTELLVDVNTIVIPFTDTMYYFFDNYKSHLGVDNTNDDQPFPDFLSYERNNDEIQQNIYDDLLDKIDDYKEIGEDVPQSLYNEVEKIHKRSIEDIQNQYWSKFLEYINNTPNPMSDPNVLDYIQSLKINYLITHDKAIDKKLEELGKLFTKKPTAWRIEKDAFISGKRWPNKVVYKDQHTFVNLIPNIDIGFEDGLAYFVDETIKDGWEADDETTDSARIWFKTFYYEVFPIYRWFFIFMLGKHKWDADDIETIKYWLILINEALYSIGNIFGKKLPTVNMPFSNIADKYFNPLNDTEDALGKRSWLRLKNRPKLPF